MATEYTSHYNLDKYTNADKPNLRDQYNSAMDKIDNQMYANATNNVTALNTANIAKAEADTAVTNSDTNAKAITTETTRATAAEKANTDAITAETTRATAAEKTNSDAVSAEETRAKAAEATNATDISTETTRAKAAEKTNADSITAETNRATAAEKVNADAISAEETRAKAAEKSNSDAIAAEETRAKAAESTNATNIANFSTLVDGCEKKLKYKKIVVIGDSLTSAADATTAWPTYLENNHGCKCYNFAMAGQGFVNNSSGTFANQLQNAINSTLFTNTEITDVIIIGGYNDYSAADATLSSAVSTLVTTAKSNFPNATIHVGAMLKGIYPLDYDIGGATVAQSRSYKIQVIEYAARSSYADIIPSPWVWLMGETAMNVDNIHVNDSGQLYISDFMYEYLSNGTVILPVKSGIATTSNNSISENHVHVYANNGIITVAGHFKTSADIAPNTPLFRLPSWAIRSNYSGQANTSLASTFDWVPSQCEGTRLYVDAEYINSFFTGTGNCWINGSWPMGI